MSHLNGQTPTTWQEMNRDICVEHEITTTLAELCGGIQGALYVGSDAKDLMELLTDETAAPSTSLDVRTTLGLDKEGSVKVEPLRGYLAERSDALRVVYNGAASPYLCRPLLMGADIVIEDLREWVSAALMQAASVPPGPVYAMIARTQACWEKMESFCQNASLTPWSETGSAALTAALEALPLTEQRRYDTALALAHYLAAHPQVAWVSYPGLPDDAAHAAAQHTLEHGFGPLITCGLMPQAASRIALGPRRIDAYHTDVTGGPQEGGLVIRAGLESPLDVVATVEQMINAQARG